MAKHSRVTVSRPTIRTMSNESVLRLAVEMIRDCHNPKDIERNKAHGLTHPSQDDITFILTEILRRMEYGHPELDHNAVKET